MHRNKITAIRTDTIEQWTFSRSIGVSEDIVCEICGAASEWLSLAYAMQARGLSAAAVCTLAESGRLHSIQTREGHLLICKVSLANTRL